MQVRATAYSLSVWLLGGGLLMLGAAVVTGCQSSPEHRAFAEELREEGPGENGYVAQQLRDELAESQQRVTELELELGEVVQELDLTTRRLSTEEGRVEALRSSVSTLETERDELNDEIEGLRSQIEMLARRNEERHEFSPLEREPLKPQEVTGDRPEAPEGFVRVDEGGFGIDIPEDWSYEVRPSLQFTEFVLSSQDGTVEMRIRMWPYPKWAGQEEIVETLHDWLVERVTEVSGARARLHPDPERAVDLVAGLPTIVTEYSYATELGLDMRHRRAAINLVEGSTDIYRSFRIDITYEAADEAQIEAAEATWEQVLGSFWLPGADS